MTCFFLGLSGSDKDYWEVGKYIKIDLDQMFFLWKKIKLWDFISLMIMELFSFFIMS